MRIINPLDLRPQGDPETVVCLPDGSLLGLHILGVPGQVMLGIREDAEGQPVSCAVTNALHIEYPTQSNPRHKKYVDVDNWREDGP